VTVKNYFRHLKSLKSDLLLTCPFGYDGKRLNLDAYVLPFLESGCFALQLRSSESALFRYSCHSRKCQTQSSTLCIALKTSNYFLFSQTQGEAMSPLSVAQLGITGRMVESEFVSFSD
jgi:hypothetical protein